MYVYNKCFSFYWNTGMCSAAQCGKGELACKGMSTLWAGQLHTDINLIWSDDC